MNVNAGSDLQRFRPGLLKGLPRSGSHGSPGAPPRPLWSPVWLPLALPLLVPDSSVWVPRLGGGEQVDQFAGAAMTKHHEPSGLNSVSH